MEPSLLITYVGTRVEAGVRKEAIKEQALAVGWSEEEFEGAYASALIANGMPMPDASRKGHTTHASTGDVVLNFFSFILLGMVVYALGALYFGVIAIFFPDRLAYAGGYDSYALSRATATIHYAIAALVVAFPLYVLTLRLWFRRFREDESKTESTLTKWITYLVLLIASVTIVGDLIYVLFQFLQGEITIRFLLKACTVLTIAGMVFGFYFLERKKIQYRVAIPRAIFQRFGYALALLVLAGVTLGFIASGGPSTERARTFDERRVNDLANIESCVNEYARLTGTLPTSLDSLGEHAQTAYCGVTDPETGEPYEYGVLTPLESTAQGRLSGTVELCATFALAGEEVMVGRVSPGMKGVGYNVHTAGRTCFERTVVVTHNDVFSEGVPLPR